jgi:hypothetical protein
VVDGKGLKGFEVGGRGARKGVKEFMNQQWWMKMEKSVEEVLSGGQKRGCKG